MTALNANPYVGQTPSTGIGLPKLQKSFQDYFRIPILLKPIGTTSHEKIKNMCKILNEIEGLSLSDTSYQEYEEVIQKQKSLHNKTQTSTKHKKSEQFEHMQKDLLEKLIKAKQMQQSSNSVSFSSLKHQDQKLLFLWEDFDNQWSEYEIIYRIRFVIGVVEETQGKPDTQINLTANLNETEGSQKLETESKVKLSERIAKVRAKLKQTDQTILGLIYLQDAQKSHESIPISPSKSHKQAENLSQEEALRQQYLVSVPSTILPSNLPLDQLTMFLEPWLLDLLKVIEVKVVERICLYRQQDDKPDNMENERIIVFNRSEEKSDQKIMKKKKKYRCIKLAGDLALSIKLYEYAYLCYEEAIEQLKKIDDYLWLLGCVQGKLACMTVIEYFSTEEQTGGSFFDKKLLDVRSWNIEEKIEELIQETFACAKKVIKHMIGGGSYGRMFEVENFFKILKLLTDQPERFDEMVQGFVQQNLNPIASGQTSSNLSSSKLISLPMTPEEKFIYFTYIGSLYQKCQMERKKNYFYYLASCLAQENQKQQISSILLRDIRNSESLKRWSLLHSTVLNKIISQEKYFNKFGELHRQLLVECSEILSKEQVEATVNYLNFGAHLQIKEELMSSEQTNDTQSFSELSQHSMIDIKEFKISESTQKPKPNRLMGASSPLKNKSGIFMGWKKKQSFLFESGEQILFSGTIGNKMPFQLFLVIELVLELQEEAIKELSLGSGNENLDLKQFGLQECGVHQKTRKKYTLVTQNRPSICLTLPIKSAHKFTSKLNFQIKNEKELFNRLQGKTLSFAINQIRIRFWNFVVKSPLKYEISFQVYQKQQHFELKILQGKLTPIQIQNEQSEKSQIKPKLQQLGSNSAPTENPQESPDNLIEMNFEQSSELKLRLNLQRISAKGTKFSRGKKVECDKLRFICSIYYDVDVGFQENEYSFLPSSETDDESFSTEKLASKYSRICHRVDSIPFELIDFQNGLENVNLEIVEAIQPQLQQSQLKIGQERFPMKPGFILEDRVDLQGNQHGVLRLFLKPFKVSREHIKRIEITIDYVKKQWSKYQINKQYTISTHWVNSVKGEIIEVSTPGVNQSQLINQGLFVKGDWKPQQGLFSKNSILEDFYLIKVKFTKGKFDLQPFKVEQITSPGSKGGQNQQGTTQQSSKHMDAIILSDQIEGERWIKLKKHTLERQNLDSVGNFTNIPSKKYQAYLFFRWKSIVNEHMGGLIRLEIPQQNPLIYRPDIDISIQLKSDHHGSKETHNSSQYILEYVLRGTCIEPHLIEVKSLQKNSTVLTSGKVKILKPSLLRYQKNPKLENSSQDKEPLPKEQIDQMPNHFANKLNLRYIVEELEYDSLRVSQRRDLKSAEGAHNMMEGEMQRKVEVCLRFETLGVYKQTIEIESSH